MNPAEDLGDAVEEAAGAAVGAAGGELEAGGDGDSGPALGGPAPWVVGGEAAKLGQQGFEVVLGGVFDGFFVVGWRRPHAGVNLGLVVFIERDILGRHETGLPERRIGPHARQ